MTSKCDIIHSNGNYLQLPNGKQIPLEDAEHHSYVPSSIFIYENDEQGPDNQAVLFCATANLSDVPNKRLWSEIKIIIDKVHKHVCGHVSLSDLETLLKRNELWSNEVEDIYVESSVLVLNVQGHINQNKLEKYY